MNAMPSDRHNLFTRSGFCVWLTGLPAAGKSTLARALEVRLTAAGYRATILDGDALRRSVSRDLGFSRADRDRHISRVGELAASLVRDGHVVICATISPYRAARDASRLRIGPDRFFEVFVSAPVEVCEARDAKGLYRRARQGVIAQFTGVSDPYEPPLHPDLIIDTSMAVTPQHVLQLWEGLARRRLLDAQTPVLTGSPC